MSVPERWSREFAARVSLLDGIDASPDPYLRDLTPAHAAAVAEFAAPFGPAEPDDARVEERRVPAGIREVPVRVYAPPGPRDPVAALVWVHGGSFVAGDLDMPEADGVARGLVTRARCVVVSIDYALAGDDVRYPVPREDCEAVLAWVHEHAGELGVDPARIAVGGASAGGDLAAATALRARGTDHAPQQLLLAYPVLHPAIPPMSAELAATVAAMPPILRFAPRMEWMSTTYAGPDGRDDPGAFPGLDPTPAGLPPVYIENAEFDDLRASGEAFAAAIATAGVDVQDVTAPGVPHGHLNARGSAVMAAALDRLALRMTGDRPTPPASRLGSPVLEAAIADGLVAGGALAVQRDGRVIERAVRGCADRESGRPVTPESVFRLASMTKPVIAVEILRLVDEGALALDTPVGDIIPALGATRVQDLDLPPELQLADPTDPAVAEAVRAARAAAPVVAAPRAITIRDLLTHSSGLGQGTGSAAAVAEVAAAATTLAERVDRYAAIPGDVAPGAGMGYSAVVGFDVLGRVIEVVRGSNLQDVLRAEILEPLGMRDTAFSAGLDQRARLVTTYRRDGAELVPADVAGTPFLSDSPTLRLGSGGLSGTLLDYERFAAFLATGENPLGPPPLTAASLRRIADERGERDLPLATGLRWGLGVVVVEEANEQRAAGTWGWSGAFGTHFWIDPARRESVVLLVNQADIGGAASPVSAALERALRPA